MKEKCSNSRTSDGIDMKLGSVTKLKKKKIKQRQQNLTMTSCQKIVTSLLFIGFMTNLEQSGRQIPDVVCEMYIFLKATFYLEKTDNRTK